ncbi:MAG: hypothetical protein ACLQAT_30270 [Candidatus Binataceae bacterium]
MRPTILVLLMFLFLGAVSWAQTSSSTEASAAERLGLKYYSTAFEETPPQWARRRGQSAIEIALGWSVARQLLNESYISRFPVVVLAENPITTKIGTRCRNTELRAKTN